MNLIAKILRNWMSVRASWGRLGNNSLHIHKDGHKPGRKPSLKSLAPYLATVKTQKGTRMERKRKFKKKLENTIMRNPSKDNRICSKIRKCKTFTKVSRSCFHLMKDQLDFEPSAWKRDNWEDKPGSFKIRSDRENMNRKWPLCISHCYGISWHLCNYQAPDVKWVKINNFTQ